MFNPSEVSDQFVLRHPSLAAAKHEVKRAKELFDGISPNPPTTPTNFYDAVVDASQKIDSAERKLRTTQADLYNGFFEQVVSNGRLKESEVQSLRIHVQKKLEELKNS